jgi:hypothetical protein
MSHRNIQVDDRDEWKARIMRALAELRSVPPGPTRSGDNADDGSSGDNDPPSRSH